MVRYSCLVLAALTFACGSDGTTGAQNAGGAGGAGGSISGGTGEDNIAGEQGNDTIYANDGSGGDTVDCGEDFLIDHDRVYYDLLDQVASNCEEKHLAAQLPNP